MARCVAVERPGRPASAAPLPAGAGRRHGHAQGLKQGLQGPLVKHKHSGNSGRTPPKQKEYQ
eukprot:4145045-Pyramimonas_sp.AAC.1